ncbi:MAG: hypothetical protein ACRCXT_13770 [Paraclostridium sp.]
MRELVKYEFRKIWTKLTFVSVISLVVVSTILNFISFINSPIGITSDGKQVKGIKSFSAIKNQSEDIKGEINQEYLNNLVKKFNLSKEKNDFNEIMKYELTKYKFSNFIINYANSGRDTYSNMLDLDFKFLESEEEFYKKYKKSLNEHIKFDNQKNWFKYTDKQMNKINQKIEKLDIPFRVDYYEGLEYFVWQYSVQYLFVIMVVAFALSSIFSKDSNNGIDELTLSSKFGRKKNMNARIIAGNIFTLVVYILFIGTLLIEIGAVVSFKGWTQSIQNLWHTCIYNISAGQGLLIMMLQGLMVIFILANLVMFMSIKFKYSKVSTIISLASIWLIERLTYTSNTLQLQLNPLYYSRSTIGYTTYYFIGDIMIPYVVAFIGLAVIYMLIIRFVTIRQYKRYKLN